jgi:carbon monoxide dehydrogenase subunit G
MEFTNEFVVPAAPEATWGLLTDVPGVAPCLPGATITSAHDGDYEGTVTVRVGPIKVTYSGTASFSELDAGAHRMVLTARGSEESGKGSASAIVSASLSPEGAAKTRVLVNTELQITGKVAQFGRSAMADIGARLIAQFAANLETMLSGTGQESPAASSETAPSATNMTGSGSELDALALARPYLKRGAQAFGTFLLGAVSMWLITRLRRR